jgi:hypothetical protein
MQSAPVCRALRCCGAPPSGRTSSRAPAPAPSNTASPPSSAAGSSPASAARRSRSPQPAHNGRSPPRARRGARRGCGRAGAGRPGPHTKVPIAPPPLTLISPRALTSTLSDLMSRCIRASECRNDTAPARRRAPSRAAPGRRGARAREGRARTERAAEEPCDLALAEFLAPRLVRLSPQPAAPPLEPLMLTAVGATHAQGAAAAAPCRLARRRAVRGAGRCSAGRCRDLQEVGERPAVHVLHHDLAGRAWGGVSREGGDTRGCARRLQVGGRGGLGGWAHRALCYTQRQRSNMKLSRYSTTFGCADVRIIAISFCSAGRSWGGHTTRSHVQRFVVNRPPGQNGI